MAAVFQFPHPPRTARPRPSERIVPANSEHVIQGVLSMLREQTGMDVVFVRQYLEGQRRFRSVEALSHGPAAALATAPAPSPDMGTLLEAAVVLRDGRMLGHLCGHAPALDAAAAERRQRALRHGARLAARLLDNEQVLRELARTLY